MLLVLALSAVGCGRSYEHLAAARAELARRVVGSVSFAVIDDPGMPAYVQGARLAAARINAAGGVLGGRLLEVRVYPGGNDFAPVRPTVERIAADPRIVAVLGHRDSRVAVPASAIYQAAGVLFMPSVATASALTRHGFDMVLRMNPDAAALAAQSASVAAVLGYRRMAVLHARDDDSRDLAFLFEDAARKEGIDIVFRGAFVADRRGDRNLFGELSGIPYDALYLSAATAAGARVLGQLRALGLRQPTIGSDRLNAAGFERFAAEAGERTLVPTAFDPDAPGVGTRRFVEAFVSAYGRVPDAAAAQGGDAVGLLAALIERTASTDPRLLSAAARFGRPWAGLTGIYAFDASGNLFGKRYRFQVLRSGRWWPLPGIDAPYRWSTLAALRDERALDAAVDAVAGNATAAAVLGSRSDRDEAPRPPGQPRPADAPGTADTRDVRSVPPPTGLDLAALSDPDLSPRRRDLIWLAQAKEILDFKRLGVVAPDSEQGLAAVGLARDLAARLGFEVATCNLPPAPARPTAAAAQTDKDRATALPNAPAPPPPTQPDPILAAAPQGPLERAALVCYGRLAIEVDAMLTVTDGSLEPRWLRQLNRTLLTYGVPAFALSPTPDADYGLTLAASGADLDDPRIAGRFGGLLRGVRVGELNRKLANLPELGLDLEALAVLDRRPDPRVLTAVSRVLEPDEPQPTWPPRLPTKTIGSDR